jgi:hypothetical protein
VHYTSYGTPGGEYTSTCRAAIIAGIPDGTPSDSERVNVVDLVVLNPEGLFFNRCGESPPLDTPAATHRGGTWHWPERV